jgi:bile acid:Na+ symporter, BASS family
VVLQPTLYSHLSNGDVALNISLTAVNSVLSLFTLPIIVNLSLQYFMNDGQYIPMQFQKVVEVFMIVLGAC